MLQYTSLFMFHSSLVAVRRNFGKCLEEVTGPNVLKCRFCTSQLDDLGGLLVDQVCERVIDKGRKVTDYKGKLEVYFIFSFCECDAFFGAVSIQQCCSVLGPWWSCQKGLVEP